MLLLDLSGYSYSGKSLLYDYLIGLDFTGGYGREFEFDLLRAPGGIHDLHNGLVTNWSPIRSSAAIQNFKTLIKNIGGTRNGKDRFLTGGRYYDQYFPGFTPLSFGYIESLVECEWRAEWPFPYLQASTSRIVREKILNKLIGGRFKSQVYVSRPDPEWFQEATKIYMNSLLESLDDGTTDIFLVSNAFEPFFPEESIRLFDGAKAIIVDRDPRDIYLSAYGSVGSISAETGRVVIGENVHDFIKRFLVYRGVRTNEASTESNTLRVRFEDFLLDHDRSIAEISELLGHDAKDAVVFERFEKSKKNISLYKNRDNIYSTDLMSDIEVISDVLSSYCYLN